LRKPLQDKKKNKLYLYVQLYSLKDVILRNGN